MTHSVTSSGSDYSALAARDVTVEVHADPDDTRDDASDQVDYYKFTLTGRKKAYLVLWQLDANASLTLEDDQGTAIKTVSKGNGSNVGFNATLDAGTHYLRVEANEEAENEYKVSYRTGQP